MERVVDGDTLRLSDGRRVRLIGVNTPELAGRQGPAQPFAEAARRWLVERIDGNGGTVRLVQGQQKQDRHGRLLAHAFDRRGNLEEGLIASGLGYMVAVAPDTDLVDCQLQAEAEARTSERGLWPGAKWLSPGQIRQGGFALVSARITAVEQNRGGLWLETDGPLVLHVAPSLMTYFDRRQLASLQGRTVSARGWVVDRSRNAGLRRGQARYLLPLTHPAMLSMP